MHACMYTAYLWNIAISTLKTHAHLKSNVVRPWRIYSSFHIGTLVVVEKRAVIEDQAYVRRVVVKAIIAK